MGTVMSSLVYLVLLVPLAYAVLRVVRRRLARQGSRLRVRVYPGSPEHLAGLREVEEGRAPLHTGRYWFVDDEAPRSGGGDGGRSA